MSIITSQQVHARNWMRCPRCDGGRAFTEKDIRQGAVCTYCNSRGEIERNPRLTNIWFGYTCTGESR